MVAGSSCADSSNSAENGYDLGGEHCDEGVKDVVRTAGWGLYASAALIVFARYSSPQGKCGNHCSPSPALRRGSANAEDDPATGASARSSARPRSSSPRADSVTPALCDSSVYLNGTLAIQGVGLSDKFEFGLAAFELDSPRTLIHPEDMNDDEQPWTWRGKPSGFIAGHASHFESSIKCYSWTRMVLGNTTD
ncbi:hypothetical protein C8Q77DRAFT_1076797 [Trametes polyzona]|nr:hypothetical protein C8Q77DRAFT_1076797 [Trametes polyzona]